MEQESCKKVLVHIQKKNNNSRSRTYMYKSKQYQQVRWNKVSCLMVTNNEPVSLSSLFHLINHLLCGKQRSSSFVLISWFT